MRVLFLGCCYSENFTKKFLKNSKRGYQFAAQNFQQALFDGFLKNGTDFRIVSVPSLSTFPFGYKRALVFGGDYLYNEESYGESVGYINLPFINHPLDKMVIAAMKRQDKRGSDRDDLHVVVYGLHRQLMRCAIKYKKENPKTKLSVIIPDLPEYMGCNIFYKKLGLKKKDTRKVYSMINQFDSYTLLTEKMAKKLLGCSNKPYVVVEGIFKEITMPTIKKSHFKVILYTGGLILRYGIGDLLEAFHRIPYDDYQLWLCGGGDAEALIKEYVHEDKRIVFYGKMESEEILKLQRRATLLVNPRHSGEAFTKYSFPSKTMEYMASGTATVMSKLECVPTEYDHYLFYFDDESVGGMTKKMIEICEMDRELLERKGRDASIFIREKKNAKVQVNKILSIL